ncbi:MAG: hypothetical protein A2W19_00075 [Spirochaetes bacterium RBG_16_49_21]|nr:MAG: hypothetical protein A2W19_00075 [Spirochaetes bacterium RBG_16_49_21]
MKQKEAQVDYKDHQLVLYVEKKDGSYGPVQTGSYIAKKYLDDFWSKRDNLEREYLEKIRKGEASPIAFYMILEELTPSELASRVRIPKRKVKRHCDPRHFGEITMAELMRYCEVFNVPVINMFRAIISNKAGVRIKDEKSANPFFGTLRIEVGKK